MVDKTVVTTGPLAVVWLWSYDTSEEAPKRVYDLYTDNDLLHSFTVTFNVEGKDMWILDKEGGNICLARYRAHGGETRYPVDDDLNNALRPFRDVPANVWARAVSEAHRRICKGRQGGCSCAGMSKEIDESGLLL